MIKHTFFFNRTFGADTIISKPSSCGATTWIEHELNASEESRTDQSKRWGVAKFLSQIVTQPIVFPLGKH